jgi:erythromycin esterase
VALQNAMLKNDAAAVSAILAPDFQQQRPDGTFKARDAYIKQQIENTPGLTVSSCILVVAKLTMHGSEAQAETTYRYIGTYTVNGIAKPFREVMQVSDDWALGRGAWRLHRSTVHDITSYVDGKLVWDEREQLAPTSAATAELRTRSVIIPTLALDADADQFAAIGAAIGNARIVGMGEGSHGSSEFFAFKNRLFKYLVERKGFTVLAMEAYWGAGLNVDRYIKTGQGTARQAVASLEFWTWDTPEVVNLIQWMHDYNAASGKHPILSFIGVDMQDPMGAIGYLAQYLLRHDPSEVNAARPALQCSAAAFADPRAKPAKDCRQQVAEIRQQLSSIKDDANIATAQQAVTNILQYLDWNSGPRDVATQTRDQDMAKNLEWVAAHHSGEKIAVWAHNGHVGTTPELNYRPMGSYLRKAFGANYYAIGQTFGAGTVRAIVQDHGLQSVSVPLNHGDTLVSLFAPLNSPAFVDLRGLPAGSALQRFFSTQHDIEEIGAFIDPLRPDQRLPVLILNSFDGLVYIPTSTASVSGTAFSQMHREIPESGAVWRVGGVGFDDVAISATSTETVLTNRDGLNATMNLLERRFDATPYIGQTVRVTGQIRGDDLFGFFHPIADVETRDTSVIAMSRGNVIDATKDGDWIPIALTLKVSQNASSIDAGFSAEGLGSVEIANLRIDASTAPRSAASPP